MRQLFFTVTCAALSFLAIPMANADLVLSVSADAANSSASILGGSVAGTLNDPFAYDLTDPTGVPLDQEFTTAANDGFLGNGAVGSTVVLSYMLDSAYITESGDIVFFDLYGEDSNAVDPQDNDFDILLFNGDYSTQVGSILMQGIPDDPSLFFHNRSTLSLADGTTFDRFQISARDADPDDDGNRFRLMELRMGVLSAIPEPSGLLLVSVLLAGHSLRRRRTNEVAI